MNTRELTESEFEDLSASVDGELPPGRAEEVRRLIETDAAWAHARRELELLDDALDAFETPAPPGRLADLVVVDVRRRHATRRKRIRLGAVAAGVSAAAAIVMISLTVYFARLQQDRPAGTQPPVVTAAAQANELLADIPASDRFVVENLDFFRDMDVVDNYDTLVAIEALESHGNGSRAQKA